MKFGCSNSFFLNTTNLICRSTAISKCLRGSLRFRDNESRLYLDSGTPEVKVSATTELGLLTRQERFSSTTETKWFGHHSVFLVCLNAKVFFSGRKVPHDGNYPFFRFENGGLNTLLRVLSISFCNHLL